MRTPSPRRDIPCHNHQSVVKRLTCASIGQCHGSSLQTLILQLDHRHHSPASNLQCQIAPGFITYNTRTLVTILSDGRITARTAGSIIDRREEQPWFGESSAATCSSQSTCLDRLTSVLNLDALELPHVPHSHSLWQTQPCVRSFHSL